MVTILDRIHDGHHPHDQRAFKLLGVYLDEYLNFNYHTYHVCNKISRSLYSINRAKNFITLKALKLLYFALIHSHLNYCSVILNGMCNKNKDRIFKLKKRAIRTIIKSNYNAHTDPLFQSLRILSFPNIMYLASVTFMHSYVYNYAPKSFNNIWQTNYQRNGIFELRNTNGFYLPVPRIELFKRSPFYTLPMLWNLLDENKFLENKASFVSAIKDKLLSG